MSPFTTTTVYQLRSLYRTQTQDMHLLSNFRIPNGWIKTVTAKATLLLYVYFISGPVLAVVQSTCTCTCSSQSPCAAPICKQWQVGKYFAKKFSWVSINHKTFLTKTFSKKKYFSMKMFQTMVHDNYRDSVIFRWWNLCILFYS